MFKVGDKAVYPAHGVGIIEAIERREIFGSQQRFYKLRILETGMTIQVPEDQVKKGGLRTVIEQDTVDKIYDILRQRNVAVESQTWNRRYREYSKKIRTGSVFEIAEVLRDLFVLKIDKDLSFGERRMLDTAQSLLIKEISIAKKMTEDEIRNEFHAMLST
ncbi:MAG: CarD family transcriptional regulator [Myxococcales bacterium]|nr:CarD family transcriptional regulator [Myxococcales bacterium]